MKINDKDLESYLDKKGYLILTGKAIEESLRDDYNAFCDEKDQISFEYWSDYMTSDLKDDEYYLIDGGISFYPIHIHKEDGYYLIDSSVAFDLRKNIPRGWRF